MTDREMLELAAKAYFGNEIDDVVSVDWCDSDECIEFAHADNQDHNGNDVWVLWDPLTDDGDALRLAVKLRMRVSVTTESCRAEKLPVLGVRVNGNDELAATRRAIVMAAANALVDKL